MNKNKNKIIYVIIILLIIALGVCISIDFTKSVGKNKKNNNVDILNIDCNDENCKKEVKPKNKDNSKTDKEDTTTANEDTNTNNNSTNSSINNGGTNGNGEGGSSTNGSGNGTSTGQAGNSTTTNNDVENTSSSTTPEEQGDLVVRDSYQTWSQKTNIKIFNVDKIAPGDSGSYDFMINNNTNKNVKYNVTFDEENEYNINLRYKLKRNNEYIAGSSSEWVKFTDLNVINKILNNKNNDTYTLEWKWVDAENDTTVGRTPGAYYKLNIHISALETDEFDKNASASVNPFTGDNVLYYIELAILLSIILLLLIIKYRQKDEYESSKCN